MAGILDSFNDPSTQGLLSLSANLLNAGGPSPTPVPIGAAFGKAYQGYQRDQQQQALIGMEKQKTDLLTQQLKQAQAQFELLGKEIRLLLLHPNKCLLLLVALIPLIGFPESRPNGYRRRRR